MWYAITIAFSVLFPDNEIVSVMRLDRNKVGYLVSFGLALYFSYLHTKIFKKQIVLLLVLTRVAKTKRWMFVLDTGAFF